MEKVLSLILELVQILKDKKIDPSEVVELVEIILKAIAIIRKKNVDEEEVQMCAEVLAELFLE